MSLDRARAHLAQFGRADDIIVTEQSSATVDLAAAALGVEPARIAKTLSFHGSRPGTAILVVMAGDARVRNAAFKQTFGLKARMLGGDDVEALTGHAPGGVCPFGVPDSATVWLDTSLRRFTTVFPACGSANSAIGLSCEDLAAISAPAGWVTVSQVSEENAA